jgi:hypothetical protein
MMSSHLAPEGGDWKLRRGLKAGKSGGSRCKEYTVGCRGRPTILELKLVLGEMKHHVWSLFASVKLLCL